MRITKVVQKALERATQLHEGQTRKGAVAIPYVVHPVIVAGVVSRYTDDEDIIAAALLHDTLEDTSYTHEKMAEEFGARVADIVRGTTIPEAEEAAGESWTADRKRYLENLRQAPDESALVAAADKLHNFSGALAQFGDAPDEFAAMFGGSTADRVHAYGLIVEEVMPRIPEPLAQELSDVWNRYKAFVMQSRAENGV